MINKRRREFITLLGRLAAAWPLAARAQQVERVRGVGVLMVGTDDADSQGRVAAFRQGLREVGWSEGRNLLITSRWGAGDNDSIRAAASDLVGLKPDVLLVNGHRGLVALQQETRTIPIVFAGLADPAELALVVHCDLIIAVAARYRLPAIYPFRVMASSGGLMSYGADVVHLSRRAASYAGRILKGENPGELPVQMATKLGLIINLKTAKALGLTVPVQLLARADEVIE
jgi:ABC-type uncharacterized transport system substrate-binding protein